MSIWDEENAKAKLYRDNWDARIAFRANQLRQLAGSRTAYQELWEAFRPIYDPFNYIEGEEQVEFFTPYDVGDDGRISSASVRLPHTTRAGRE
jgi:hypothetical protein